MIIPEEDLIAIVNGIDNLSIYGKTFRYNIRHFEIEIIFKHNYELTIYAGMYTMHNSCFFDNTEECVEFIKSILGLY